MLNVHYYLLDIVGSYLLINLSVLFLLLSVVLLTKTYSAFLSLSSSMETLQRADSWLPWFPGMMELKSTGWNLSILWKSG